MSERDEFRDSVPAWLLGALDPDESESVSAHVETCDACQVEVARLRPVAASIGLASPTVEAPAGLRNQVLERARKESEIVAAGDRHPRQVTFRPRTRPGLRRRLPLEAVAAIVAISLLAGAAAGAVAARLTSGQSPAPVSQYMLTGHGAMSGTSAQVIELQSDRVTFVTFSHLQSPPDGDVYEIWLIKTGSAPVAAGLFVPEADGSKTVLLGRSLTGFSTMAVTVEAAPNGAPAPTQQPELYGSVG